MNEIRLNRIYNYYSKSAANFLDELKRVKELYRDGEISYHRAMKLIDYLVRQIQWRTVICYGCSSTMSQSSAIFKIENTTNDIIAWTNM